MATAFAAAHAASDNPPTRFDGWRSVPEHFRTTAQWKRQGRTVKAGCKKAPAAVVAWNGLEVKVYSEEQTSPYRPRPETVAFRDDCQAFTSFLNPRRDRYAFKPRKEWENKDWPQTTDHLSDDTLERAFSHREGVAFLPAAAGDFRSYVLDLDFHDARADPERFLGQVGAVHDKLVEDGDDFFMACRERNVSGMHFWGFGPARLQLKDILRYAEGVKADLIARHPDLFDESLEVYPDPGRPFRLPIFPGRCPILDVPLEGVPPREQLARLVRWIDCPGTPMPKGDLLDWVRARLPTPAIRREGGGQLHIADTKVPPVPNDLPPVTEDDFLDGLDCGPVAPGYLPGEDFFAEKARAELAGRLGDWERLRSSEGARAAMSFLDGLGVPSADKVKDELGRVMVAGFLLWQKRKGTARRDVASEWQHIYRRSGWDAAVRLIDGVKAGLQQPAPIEDDDDLPTPPVVANPPPAQAILSSEKADAREKPPSNRRNKVDYRGRFIEIQHSFWGMKQPPPNGSLNAVLGPHLRLCLAFGKTTDEIDAFYRRELLDRPDVSFSRRLSEDPEKVFRSERATARKIERDNGYQPDPVSSTAIFRRLAAAFRRRGLDPLDPTAFGRYRRSGNADRTPREAELNEEARGKVLKHAGWLHKDAEVVLKAARLVAGFVQHNPGRQLAAVLVPELCGDLPVKWLCGSDAKARRCKKAERFLAALVASGVLEVARPPLFLGPRNPDNRATEYALGQAMRASDREGGGQLLIADMVAPAHPWHDFLVRELRRLRRRGRRHGPSERRRVA